MIVEAESEPLLNHPADTREGMGLKGSAPYAKRCASRSTGLQRQLQIGQGKVARLESARERSRPCGSVETGTQQQPVGSQPAGIEGEGGHGDVLYGEMAVPRKVESIVQRPPFPKIVAEGQSYGGLDEQLVIGLLAAMGCGQGYSGVEGHLEEPSFALEEQQPCSHGGREA